MRFPGALAACCALALVPGGVATAQDTASPVCTPRSAPVPQAPATLLSDTPVNNTGGRLHDLKLQAPALNGATHAYVLLPKDYDPSGATRYPVVYLLHGGIGTYWDWYGQGNVIGITDKLRAQGKVPPFIAVLPDGGPWGFYTDWYGSDIDGHTPDPPPAWATYHVGELVPYVDAHYPTLADRSHRAIAGLSMGGFGAMSYAARYPDVFGVAGSFSGAVNPNLGYPFGSAFLTFASLYFDNQKLDQCIWGDMVTQHVRWQGDDPTELAGNLGNTALFVASGGGDQDVPQGLVADPVEELVFLMSRAFTRALDAAGVAHTDDFYGMGTHTWEYWQRDLESFLPLMAKAFAQPKPAPPAVPFAYRSIRPRFSLWGWDFTTHRSTTAFTELAKVGRSGLTASGSGTLGVVTAPLYEPRRGYRVGTQHVTADAAGRLHFTLDLAAPASVTIDPEK
jgi:S-formylglutathione hydrolase FrmB